MIDGAKRLPPIDNQQSTINNNQSSIYHFPETQDSKTLKQKTQSLTMFNIKEKEQDNVYK